MSYPMALTTKPYYLKRLSVIFVVGVNFYFLEATRAPRRLLYFSRFKIPFYNSFCRILNFIKAVIMPAVLAIPYPVFVVGSSVAFFIFSLIFFCPFFLCRVASGSVSFSPNHCPFNIGKLLDWRHVNVFHKLLLGRLCQ